MRVRDMTSYDCWPVSLAQTPLVPLDDMMVVDMGMDNGSVIPSSDFRIFDTPENMPNKNEPIPSLIAGSRSI